MWKVQQVGPGSSEQQLGATEVKLGRGHKGGRVVRNIQTLRIKSLGCPAMTVWVVARSLERQEQHGR